MLPVSLTFKCFQIVAVTSTTWLILFTSLLLFSNCCSKNDAYLKHSMFYLSNILSLVVRAHQTYSIYTIHTANIRWQQSSLITPKSGLGFQITKIYWTDPKNYISTNGYNAHRDVKKKKERNFSRMWRQINERWETEWLCILNRDNPVLFCCNKIGSELKNAICQHYNIF